MSAPAFCRNWCSGRSTVGNSIKNRCVRTEGAAPEPNDAVQLRIRRSLALRSLDTTRRELLTQNRRRSERSQHAAQPTGTTREDGRGVAAVSDQLARHPVEWSAGIWVNRCGSRLSPLDARQTDGQGPRSRCQSLRRVYFVARSLTRGTHRCHIVSSPH
jgi:hypothetical protein